MKNLIFHLLMIMIFTANLIGQTDYRELHKKSIVVDMHADVLLNVLRGADISQSLR